MVEKKRERGRKIVRVESGRRRGRLRRRVRSEVERDDWRGRGKKRGGSDWVGAASISGAAENVSLIGKDKRKPQLQPNVRKWIRRKSSSRPHDNVSVSDRNRQTDGKKVG